MADLLYSRPDPAVQSRAACSAPVQVCALYPQGCSSLLTVLAVLVSNLPGHSGTRLPACLWASWAPVVGILAGDSVQLPLQVSATMLIHNGGHLQTIEHKPRGCLTLFLTGLAQTAMSGCRTGQASIAWGA